MIILMVVRDNEWRRGFTAWILWDRRKVAFTACGPTVKCLRIFGVSMAQ